MGAAAHSITRERVLSFTLRFPLSTADTLARDNPHICAMSSMVTLRLRFFPVKLLAFEAVMFFPYEEYEYDIFYTFAQEMPPFLDTKFADPHNASPIGISENVSGHW